MDKTDTELSDEIKRGNRRSFREIYNRYHKNLYYLAWKYLKNENLAEDAVQDIFLKFWRKRKSLDHSLSVEGFLFTMLKNHVLNMVRDENNRKKIIREVSRSSQNTELQNVVEEEIIYDEYKEMFKEALTTLSPAQREVFEQRSLKGLSNGEIANKRNVSKHTVKTQYYLGSKAIRDYLEKHGGVVMIIFVLFVLCIGE